MWKTPRPRGKATRYDFISRFFHSSNWRIIFHAFGTAAFCMSPPSSKANACMTIDLNLYNRNVLRKIIIVLSTPASDVAPTFDYNGTAHEAGRTVYNMKRITTICLIALCAALLCLTMAQGAQAPQGLSITAIHYPLYIAALNITQGAKDVTVNCFAKELDGCLHDFQMTPDDRMLLEQSRVLLTNGVGMESFLGDLLGRLPASVIDTSEGIPILLDAHGDENPHIWMSIQAYSAQVQNIVTELSAIDPQNAALYAQNGEAYRERLSALYETLDEMLSPIAGTSIITFHSAFDYFANEFSLGIAATVQGEHDEAPSARHLSDVAGIIRDQSIKALFQEPGHEDRSVDILARETGVPVYTLDPVTTKPDGIPPLTAYEDVQLENARVLLEALS